MIDFIWHSVWAQLGIAGVLVVGLLAAAWFSPVFKRWFIGAAGFVLAAATIYAKGAADQARREKEKRDAAVKKAQADYDKIDKRTDTPGDVDKRLRDGSF
jgi:hypothetical protein